jgi:hypothetical protein
VQFMLLVQIERSRFRGLLVHFLPR